MVASSLASAPLFDTAPPDGARPSLLGRMKARTVASLSGLILPLVEKAARPYMGGKTVGEALLAVDRLSTEGIAATLGFWDLGGETPAQIADIAFDAMDCLSWQARDCTVSLKPPALHYAPDLARALGATAAALGLRLHCDSHGADMADFSNDFADTLAEALGPDGVGTTLPGRWWRSLGDADWAAEKGYAVRVVKGQWPDPEAPGRDLAEGFFAVIDRLAGKTRHVAVATHDFELGRSSLLRLREAGTVCELEVLLGMPAAPLLAWARQNGFKTRVYVPYGPGFVPNAVGVLRRNPRLLLSVAKDRLQAVRAALTGAGR